MANLRQAEQPARVPMHKGDTPRGMLPPGGLRALVRAIRPSTGELAQPLLYLRGALLHFRLLRGGYTMISSRRGRTLHRLAREVESAGLPGSLVDCGVYNGGSTALLSAGAPSRRVWAFDSFEGLPEPGPEDSDAGEEFTGDCLGSEQRVREAFERFAHPERLKIVKGWFDQTVEPASREIGDIAILHCDGDWYDSVKVPLEQLYPQVVPGGYVVIDDYGYWAGARRAADEYRAAHSIDAPMHWADEATAFWQKP
jgi:hypothetical protein